MRVPRVSLVIPSALNKHRKYLYNECLDLMNKYKFGGTFTNEEIKFSAAPQNVIDALKELKINYII